MLRLLRAVHAAVRSGHRRPASWPREAGTVVVYRRETRFFLQLMDRTEHFLWIEREALELGTGIDPRALGTAVRTGLTTSGVIPHPRTWPTGRAADGLLPPLAGVKTWRAFAAGAASATVDVRDGRVSVMPARRTSDGRTYEPLLEAAFRFDQPLDRIHDHELGAAVVRGLDASGDDAEAAPRA